MFAGPAIFSGTLMHRRYQPMRHGLSYQVADVLLDVDQLEQMNTTSWLFGYNRKRLFSIHDKNHGPGDGTAIAKHVRDLMQGLDLEEPIARIFMLCYPAVLGRVFNPITVYFGLAKDGQWQAVVYEVNNTFGQRHSYVLPVSDGTGHKTEKCFYVSPFNNVEGEYRFNVERRLRHLRLNIALFEQGKLKMAARFEGNETALTDTALLRGLLRLTLQPMKVWAAIHWQALQLFFKGLRPTIRPGHPRFAASYKNTPLPSSPDLQRLDASR
jgi:uncharacterized protein